MSKATNTTPETQDTTAPETKTNTTADTTAPEIQDTTTPKTTAPETQTNTAPETTEPAKPVEGSNEWLQEKVPVKLFSDGEKYTGDVVVSVNGFAWQIQRGVTVMIPRYVALQLELIEKQRQKATYYRDEGWKSTKITQEGKED